MIKFEKLGIVMKPLKDQFGSFARFNPGVQLKDGIVHMLYRATNSDIKDGANYISYIGYAKLDVKTETLLYDSNEKVIYPTLPEEIKGCEDPRIVEFEGSFYIFYTAFDGITARVAIARTDDFIQYDKLGIINHFGWDKDAFIFPERINGMIAYLHRISPRMDTYVIKNLVNIPGLILIEYFCFRGQYILKRTLRSFDLTRQYRFFSYIHKDKQIRIWKGFNRSRKPAKCHVRPGKE